jgi:hypothetical protein
LKWQKGSFFMKTLTTPTQENVFDLRTIDAIELTDTELKEVAGGEFGGMGGFGGGFGMGGFGGFGGGFGMGGFGCGIPIIPVIPVLLIPFCGFGGWGW